MRTKNKSLLLSLCGIIMALSFVLGFWFSPIAKADGAQQTGVSMINGASVRIDVENPGLVYYANVSNYDADATYGMIFVENTILKSNQITSNFIAQLDGVGADYKNVVCTPYEVENGYQIKGFYPVLSDKLTTDYAGIAYATKGGETVYSAYSENNVRNVKYIAQKALIGDSLTTSLREDLQTILGSVTGGDYGQDGEGNGNVDITETNTVATVTPDFINEANGSDGSFVMSFMSNQSFYSGSIVSFDVFVPAEYEEIKSDYWLVLGWSQRPDMGVGLYDWVNGNGTNLRGNIKAGQWNTVTTQIPEDGSSYYIYLTVAKGEWNNKKAGDELVYYTFSVDNFKITYEDEEESYEITEDFEGEEYIFNFAGNANHSAEEIVKIEKMAGKIEIGGDEEPEIPVEPEYKGEYGAKINMDKLSSEADKPTFITASKYAGGVTVTFDYYMSGNANDKWWTFNWTTSNTVASIYAFVENNP
ncbi:MAG: hypothetical protein E7360_06955, partial [Clostridiales bacterium]|nr:hypothetical protein [Clostridiales bacterium]